MKRRTKTKILALLLACAMVLSSTGTVTYAESPDESASEIVEEMDIESDAIEAESEETDAETKAEGEETGTEEADLLSEEEVTNVDEDMETIEDPYADEKTEIVEGSEYAEDPETETQSLSEVDTVDSDAMVTEDSDQGEIVAAGVMESDDSEHDDNGLVMLKDFNQAGTITDPWLIGADNEGDVTAYIVEDNEEIILYIKGTGVMADGSGGNSAWPWQDSSLGSSEQHITKAVIGDGVTYIGRYCFQNCNELTSVELPESLTEIGDSSFYGCSALTEINLPSTLESIGKYAFAGSGITEIKIPTGIVEIADYTFQDCSDLKSVEIPETVISIGLNAFDGCRALESIELPSGLEDLDGYAFRYCSSLKTVTLPEGITEVEQNTFRGCTSLEEVEAEGTITSIGGSAFYGCTSLKEVFDLSKVVYANATYIFYNCSSLEGPLDLSSMTEICIYTFSGCKSLTGVTFSEELTAIDSYAFQNCTSLTSVDFPDTLTTIKDHAFYGCTGLNEMELPNSLKTIGNYAFYNCPLSGEYMQAITTVDAGAAIYNLNSNETETTQEDKTYSGKTVVIPASVTSIGTNAFENSRVEIFVVGNSITDVDGLEFASTALSAVIFDNFQSWVTVENESNLKKHLGTSADVNLVFLLGTDDNGIYLDGVNGSDETGDGSEDKPVRTFAKAKELAAEGETQYIYVTGTVTVNEVEEWDGSVEGSDSNLSLLRIKGDSNMIIVDGPEADLTLKDITINGRNLSSTASMISVTDGGKLNIENGAVIQKNYRSSSAGGNLADEQAAVMVRDGDLVLDGGEIRENTGGKFGGAVALIASGDNEKVSMNFKSGTISGSSAEYGGGIYMYGNATLNMTGGKITSNSATRCGGGIFVGPDATATISAGYITENRQTTNVDTYGGGGIYVESNEGAKRSDGSSRNPGQLYLYNVEIAGNYFGSSRYGEYIATIGCCQTGNVDINITKGAVIHDNQEYETVYVARNNSSGSFTLPAIMLGGGAYNWSTTSGTLIDLDDLANDNTSTVRAVTHVSTDDGTVTGLDRCTTYITDNYAVVMGSAIGTNGNVTIGYNDGDVTIDIEKVWNDAGDEDTWPDEVMVYVYATDGYGDTTCIGSVTLNEENSWKSTISELPKYDSDGLEYTYSVKEAAIDGWMSDVTGGKTETSTLVDGDYDTDEEKTAKYEFTITNTAARELSISKEIYGNSDEDSYEFRIELNKDNELYTGDIIVTYFMTQDNDEVMASRTGIVSFENGVGTVNIQAGETVTLEVGYGMHWTVSEMENNADETYVSVDGSVTKAKAASGTVADSSEVIFINSYREYFDLDEETIPDGDDAEHRESWKQKESVNEYDAIELEMSTFLPVIEPDEVRDGEITLLFHNKLDEGLKLDANEESDLHITIGGKEVPAEYYTVEVFAQDDDVWTIAPLALVDNDECTFHVTVDLSSLYNETNIVNDEDLDGDTEMIIYFYVDLEGIGMDGIYSSTVQYQVFDGDDLLYTSNESVVYLYTYEIEINKSSTTTGSPLAGATFGVYYDEDCTQPIMRYGEAYTVTSDEDGKVLFYGLASGTYYLKELSAPEGYVLSDEVIKVELGDESDDSGYTYEIEFGNTPEPEPKPTPEPDDKSTEKKSTTTQDSETTTEEPVSTTSAKTGDESHLVLWASLICCSVVVLTGMWFAFRKARIRK